MGYQLLHKWDPAGTSNNNKETRNEIQEQQERDRTGRRRVRLILSFIIINGTNTQGITTHLISILTAVVRHLVCAYTAGGSSTQYIYIARTQKEKMRLNC